MRAIPHRQARKGTGSRKMDSLSSFHVPILRGHEFGPVHNEQNPQSVGPCLRELEAQARSPAASLPLGASLRASSSGDERGQLRCPGMRRSTASASRRAVSADSRSSLTSPHPAIANRRRTGQEGVPAREYTDESAKYL